MDRDLGELKRQFAQKTEEILKEESSGSEAEPLHRLDSGRSSGVLELERQGQTLVAIRPGRRGRSRDLQVFDSRKRRARASRRGAAPACRSRFATACAIWRERWQRMSRSAS